MADIKKLKSVGICTVKGIQMTTRKALCNIKGLSEAKVEKIKDAAGKMLVKWDLYFCEFHVILQPALLYSCGLAKKALGTFYALDDFLHVIERRFPDRLWVQREEEAGVPRHYREPGVRVKINS